MKRILIYFNSMQSAGGVERVIVTLCDRLASQYAITILVKDEPRSFYELNKHVKIESLYHPLNFNMKNSLSRVYAAVSTIYLNHGKLKKYLSANSFDYYYVAHPLQVLEIDLAGVDKSKVIISEHGAKSAYNFIYKLLKLLLYKRCRQYVVPTTSDTQSYRADKLPAVYIPHFRSSLPYRLAPKIANTVLSIGRFTAEKQQHILINIWNRIIHHHGLKSWKLKLVGTGELEEELRQQVDQCQLNDYVQFSPPSIHVENYYKESSLFVLSSNSEGFGMVLLEAISFGLPCISFDCPSGPRDIIKHGITGFLIEQNNSQQFESTLIQLLENKSLLDKMGRVAYINSQQWGDEAILKKWQQILT